MAGSLRKRIFCLWSFVILSFTVAAQQEYFVFIQSDNSQPFYAKIGEKVYSASSIGHLVIPELKDSTYVVSIGFPKNQYPEIDFVIPIGRKDQGYQLKNVVDQGWVLFNLLTLQLLKPKQNATSVNHPVEIKKKTDGYSVLMAGVVNDTSVLYSTSFSNEPLSTITQQVKQEPVKETRDQIQNKFDSISSAKNTVAIPNANNNPKDSVVVVETDITPQNPIKSTSPAKIPLVQKDSLNAVIQQPTAKADSIASESVIDSSTKAETRAISPVPVIKITEQFIDSSLKMQFLISERNNKDTVTLTIQVESVAVTAGTLDTVSKKGIATDVKNAPKTDSPVVKKVMMVNSDCRNFASDHDVDKLRVKILAEKKDNEKIAAARKFYKSKCFTARQIRALSELFYIEHAKYDFLAASFPFVSDSENYRQLESLFSDRLYVEKFRNLFPD